MLMNMKTPRAVARVGSGLKPLAAGLLGGLLLAAAGSAQAVSVTKTYVGTLSNTLSGGNNNGMVARGNKYVIKTTFDTDDIVAVNASTPGTRNSQSRDFQSIALGDALGGTNTFELLIPSEGFGGVLTQTGQDHFDLTPFVAAPTATTAEIHFFNPCNSAAACAAEFRGFEFESNFVRANSPTTPAVGGDIVFELRDVDTGISGTTVTNQVVNVLDENLAGIMFNGGTTDVRSESNAASGGQQNPGVFLGEAVDVVAEAGAAPLVYSAGALSVTTDAGTEQVTETPAPIVPGTLRSAPSAFDSQPRQADNDLGAARGDGEDFLTFAWTAGGANLAGNEDGTRINREVQTLSPGGFSFVNNGTRTVENVNITRSLAQSGLQNTTDTTTFDVTVTEALTGLSDTDSVVVSYNNAGPSATAGPGVVFDATNFMTTQNATGSADDPDLAANAQVAGFETLSAQFSIGGTNLGAAQNLGSPAAGPVALTQNVTLADAFAGGLTMTTSTATLDLEITDFAGATATDSQTISYANTLPAIASASHTVNAGFDINCAIDYDDADLAVNAFLGVPDFEMLTVQILVDGIDRTAFFAGLLGTGGTSQLVSNGDLLATFGLGLHTFKLNVSDKAMLAGAVMPVMASFDFEVQDSVTPR